MIFFTQVCCIGLLSDIHNLSCKFTTSVCLHKQPEKQEKSCGIHRIFLFFYWNSVYPNIILLVNDKLCYQLRTKITQCILRLYITYFSYMFLTSIILILFPMTYIFLRLIKFQKACLFQRKYDKN